MALSAIDYRVFLKADSPEEKMLAILGDFGNTDRRQVVEKVVSEVMAASKGGFPKLRYLRQLLILSNLRKLVPEKQVIMESIETWFKLENDILFVEGEERGMKKGMERGIEQGKEEKSLEVVKALLLNTHFSVGEIAGLVNVSEAFVQKVKQSL